MARDAYVFSHEPDSSAPWRPDSTTRAFRLLVKRAGTPGVRRHDLRHYVATRLLAAAWTCALWPAGSATATPPQPGMFMLTLYRTQT
jgi:integrase